MSFAQIMLYRSDNCFTIVEGINPGAEVLPPVLMKGPPSDVGTPVEQIVLADSNRLPENGLFEIRDTRTGRRIHPSEVPFTLTFTPYSSSIPPFSKYYGPITAMEFEATTKAEEYNERKRKYEESNYVFYDGSGAPIYRPPKFPPDAGETDGGRELYRSLEELTDLALIKWVRINQFSHGLFNNNPSSSASFVSHRLS